MTTFHSMMTSIMITSSIMAISSNNWLMLWTAMELNMLSFIPLMFYSNKFQEMEAAIKYFLTQALGSSLMLMSASSMWLPEINKFIISSIIVTSMVIKLGMAPCHLWFPSVMASLSWINCTILSSWQKIAPLTILSFMIINKSSLIIILVSILSALVGGAYGMNQSKIKSMMAYSSITHLGWMSSLIIITRPLFSLIYLFFYSLLITPLFMIMHKLNIMNNYQLNNFKTSMFMSLMIPLLIMSLGGLPPLTGFIPKWMSITLLWPMMKPVLVILIIGSMMNLFFYLNLSFNFMLQTESNMKSPSIMKNYSMLSMVSLMLLFIPLFMLKYALTMFN